MLPGRVGLDPLPVGEWNGSRGLESPGQAKGRVKKKHGDFADLRKALSVCLKHHRGSGAWREARVGEERAFSFVVGPQDCVLSSLWSKELSHLVLKFKLWFLKERNKTTKLVTGEQMKIEIKSCLQLVLSVASQAGYSFFSFLLWSYNPTCAEPMS